jgi:hypothetical protein
VDIKEIVIGVRDIVAARQIWERLVQPVSSPGGTPGEWGTAHPSATVGPPGRTRSFTLNLKGFSLGVAVRAYVSHISTRGRRQLPLSSNQHAMSG